MIREMHIYVTGVVQGVGFRAAVKRYAILSNIKGFVRNLPDARVEICVQGSEEQIRAFLSLVESKPGMGKISSLETIFKPMKEDFQTFDIL